MRKYLLGIGLAILTLLGLAQAKQVTCIGDSITYGYGISNRTVKSYPAQLESLLQEADETWQVSNFGVNSKTLLSKGDQPYIETSAYQQALASEPNIVIIMLGTNDAKPENWIYSDEYVADYCDLIDSFQELSSNPEVWICKPVPAFEDRWNISPTVIRDEIPPMIDEIAEIMGAKVIDLHAPLLPYGDLFPDGIHPNAEGAGIMAQTIAPYLLGILTSADLTGDGLTNFLDLATLAEAWLCDSNSLDLLPVPEGDNFIDAQDLMGLSQNWLTTPGMVAHWLLDEEAGDIAIDRIGDFNGVLVGEPLWRPNAGVSEGALQLDGIDDHVELGILLDPEDGPFSLIAWVQGGGPDQVILSQGNSAKNAITLLGTNDQGALMTTVTDGGRGTSDLVSEGIITDGQWHQVGLIWDEVYRSLYVDNTLVAQDTDTLNSLQSSNKIWRLGTSGNKAQGTFWMGLIDDVRVYDLALAQP